MRLFYLLLEKKTEREREREREKLPSGSISFKKPGYIIFCSHSFVRRRFKKKKKKTLKISTSAFACIT